VQTLQMSLLDSLFGVLVAIPPASFSAHNVTPGRRSAYPIGRSLIV
jgi:ABC-type phosphate/phosphonate transport system permease subunit